MTDVTQEPLREALRPRGPVQFGLRQRRGKDGTVLAVYGELDLLTAPKLAARLDLVMRKGTGDLVLDLRSVRFIDSLGLSIILNAHRRLEHAGRCLRVRCGDGPVRRVIEMARLEETLGLLSAQPG